MIALIKLFFFFNVLKLKKIALNLAKSASVNSFKGEDKIMGAKKFNGS